MHGMKKLFGPILFLICILFSFQAEAQQLDSLVRDAQKYRLNYCYEKAIRCYELAQELAADSLRRAQLDEEKQRCDSTLAQTKVVPVLKVVARARFSRHDFFLYYPLPDKSFRQVEGTQQVIYHPGAEEELYLSREQGEEMLFSMSYDNKLYYSAAKEDGYGGYDLYYCDWDEDMGEWSEPRNLGFPYSSAGDDFLFIETEDGMFNIFASNRSCSKDSVYVYVIDKNASQDYTSNTSDSTRVEMAKLLPEVSGSTLVGGSSLPDSDPWSEKYQRLVERERELVELMENASSEERPTYQAELDQLAEDRSRVEEYIFNSNARTREISEEVDREVAGVEGSFIFLKRSIGKPIRLFYIDD